MTPPSGDLVDALRAAGCVWAEDEAAVLRTAAIDETHLWRLARRRMSGEPLEQVVGWAQFCGLRIVVEPGVFVPRRRSEPLVAAACAAARAVGRPPVLVDLCCGSGALGAAVAARVDVAELHAADIDPAAARCAGVNLASFGGQVHVGDLFDALPAHLRGRVDVLVVNAPYVPTGRIATLPAEARRYEPRAALDGGLDGVAVHRRVAAGVSAWLAPGGVVLIETSGQQAEATLAALTAPGLMADTVASADDADAVIARGSLASGDLSGS